MKGRSIVHKVINFLTVGPEHFLLAHRLHGVYSHGKNDLLSWQKTSKFGTFLENIQFLYVYVSVDNSTINSSGRYFTFRDCNLENIVTKL